MKWHGNNCFSIKGKDATVLVCPESDKMKGDIVISSLAETPAINDVEKVIDWPGEYEVKGVPITGFQASTKEEGGETTTVYCFSVDGIKFCHLGALGHKPSSEMINKIGDVDILMINADKDSPLGPKGAEDIMEEIDPRAVVTMGSGQAEALKELGSDKYEPENKFSIKKSKDLPDDKRLYIALNKV